MHVYVCLLASMLYIHVCLSRYRLCHALCPLWACVLVWCCCTWCTPFSALCDVDMLALLAFCHQFGFLCFFASLYTCLHVHAWVCVSSILQSNGIMDTWSKFTFVRLGYPLLFDNMFVCLFVCFTSLLAPVCHLLLACLLACFPSTCFFACLLAFFFCHCTYMHGAWKLGARVWSRRRKQKGKYASKNMQAHKGQCSVD